MIEKWWEDEHTRAVMREYVHRDRLVGPFAAERIDHDKAKQVLFDYHERIYRDISVNPSFIVGRRGSGKSAYLDHLQTKDRYNLVIKIDKNKVFQDTIRWLETNRRSVNFVEDIAAYWDCLFYTLIAAELFRQYPILIGKNEFISRYLGALNVRSQGSAAGFIRRLLRRVEQNIRDKAADGDLLSAIFIDLYDEFDEPLDYLKETVVAVCRKNGIRVVILLDSLENYRLDSDAVKYTVEGFLRSVGSYNSSKYKPELKCCLPSELFYYFLKSSSNTGKDFSQPLLIHWRSHELLSVVAHRMMAHIRLYGDGDPDTNKRLMALDLNSRDGVHSFFSICFPEQITNEAGIAENCEFFILRHTQMLPRQVLKIFHSILKLNQDATGEYARIAPKFVEQGVYQLVNELATGVCGAYRFQYPDAWMICRDVVNRLPHTFGHAELEKLYRMFLKKNEHTGFSIDELGFARMLTELGCIGEVRDETEQYLKCQFEYNSRGELTTDVSASFCVHPMFRGPNGNRKTAHDIGKAVHPIGANGSDSTARG